MRILRLGLTEPLFLPKMTMEMGVHRVHGRTHPPRVSPAPATSTHHRHGHIGRVGRGAAIALIETSRASTRNTSELLSLPYDSCDEPEIVLIDLPKSVP